MKLVQSGWGCASIGAAAVAGAAVVVAQKLFRDLPLLCCLLSCGRRRLVDWDEHTRDEREVLGNLSE